MSVTADQVRALRALFAGVKVVLGYGLGVDSTAILLRWLYEPWTMPCKPEELLVVTAMPTQDDETKGVWNRSVRSIAAGTRQEMLRDLGELAAAEGAEVEKDELAVSRAWTTRRNEGFPCYERLYVVAPAGANDKEEKRFQTAMARYQEYLENAAAAA